MNPRVAFDVLFPNPMMPPDDPMDPVGPGPSALLVDRVLADYRRAMNSPNLSAADRMTLDRHVTYLTELEGRVNAGGGGGRRRRRSRVHAGRPRQPRHGR